MKITLIAMAIILFPCWYFAQSGTISVQISGIKETKGYVMVGLYDKNSYKTSAPIAGGKIKANKKVVEYIFTNVKEGEYAVSVFHDINNNEKIDKNFFGVPKEHYGFSNNQFGLFGPPDFDKIAFKVVPSQEVLLNIKLND